MFEDLNHRYGPHLCALDQLMADELDCWPWLELPEMLILLRGQLQRKGKRLRPLLMFAFVDMLGGDFTRSYPAAAAVELFHVASLILDDIQDNSDYRHGAQTVHTTSSISTAINLAGIIRSFSYHPLHRSACITPQEKEQIHRRLNTAVTHLFMGQSVDIGWRERWYRSIDEFPYQQMVTWKTGSLFGCAAWLAAFACDADVATAERFGTDAGVFYQLLNDYLDVFGTGDRQLRPVSEDLREGAPSWPVITLYQELRSRGDETTSRRLSAWLTDPTARSEGYGWVVTLMRGLGLEQKLRASLLDHAARLSHEARGLVRADPAGLELFIQSLRRLADPQGSPTPRNLVTAAQG